MKQIEGNGYKLYLAPCQEVELENQFDCMITSPPYYNMRWKETDNPLELGTEKTEEEYLNNLSDVLFRLSIFMKTTGNMFINLGDKMWKKKQLLLPQRLAMELEKKGLILHQEIIWEKSNNMPNSYHDRLTIRTESILWMVKDVNKFYHNIDPLREPHKTKHLLGNTSKQIQQDGKYASSENDKLGSPRARARRDKEVNFYHPLGRNPGNVWEIPTEKHKELHFSAMPYELARRLVLLGSPNRGLVLDPFNGSGTTMLAARSLGRDYIGIDVSEDYIAMTARKAANVQTNIEAFI